MAREAFGMFLGARVFCRAPGPDQAPGVLAVGRPGDGAVPVFTSLEELARFHIARGETGGVEWFATTGEDLLGLIPDGYAVLLDPGSEHAILLHPTDIQELPRKAKRTTPSDVRSPVGFAYWVVARMPHIRA